MQESNEHDKHPDKRMDMTSDERACPSISGLARMLNKIMPMIGKTMEGS